MAFVVADRVKESTTTTGTGTVTLSGATPGFQSFGAIGTGNTTYYCIASATEWEVGIGTYTSGTNTLTRTTVLSSSNAGALVNFGVGAKDVFVALPSSKAIVMDSAGVVQLGTNWTVKETAGVLYFASGGTNRMKVDASGNLTVAGTVVLNGTV